MRNKRVKSWKESIAYLTTSRKGLVVDSVWLVSCDVSRYVSRYVRGKQEDKDEREPRRWSLFTRDKSVRVKALGKDCAKGVFSSPVSVDSLAPLIVSFPSLFPSLSLSCSARFLSLLSSPTSCPWFHCLIHSLHSFSSTTRTRIMPSDPTVTRCSAPTGCSMDKPFLRMNNLGDAVRVICNNNNCQEGRFMHKDCFEEWESTVLSCLRSCGRARSWSEKQRLQNLWTKKGWVIL